MSLKAELEKANSAPNEVALPLWAVKALHRLDNIFKERVVLPRLFQRQER